MRRTFALLAVAALAAFLLPAVAAAKPTPLAFGPWEYEDTQQPVEQQTPGGATQPDRSLWVVNNTGCAWDADDSRSAGAVNRYLDAGASASVSKCFILDGMAHWWAWSLAARSPDLSVCFTVYEQTRCSGATPGYVYQGCASVEVDEDYPLPPVADSNGGHGIPTEATLTVSNPTGRTVRDINVSLTMKLSNFGACPHFDNSDIVGFLRSIRTGVFPGPFYSWDVTP